MNKSLILAILSLNTASLTQAQPQKTDTLDKTPAAEPAHIHDENCGHNHLVTTKAPNIEQVRTFLKLHATYIIPEFEKVMKGNDEEHIQWMMKDISKIMQEHAALNTFDPKVASLFIEVFKLENDLYLSIEKQLEAGVKPQAAGQTVKPQLKILITKRLELEKGQIAYQKAQLDKELIELTSASNKVDQITEQELKQIINELKQSQKEAEKEAEKK